MRTVRRKVRPRPRLLAQMPWEFMKPAQPGEPAISWEERMPPEAAEIGECLARIAEVGAQVLAANGLAVSDPCRSCAFREGTVPNRCIDTQGDAFKCVFEGKRFFCHAPHDGRLCAGFIQARAWAVAAEQRPEIFRAAFQKRDGERER